MLEILVIGYLVGFFLSITHTFFLFHKINTSIMHRGHAELYPSKALFSAFFWPMHVVAYIWFWIWDH